MAQGGPWFGPSGFIATADYRTKQYYVVKHASTAGEAKLASGTDDELLGILQNEPNTDEAALVACLGIAKAAAETGVTAGCALTASSTGRVKKTTTDKHKVIGYALEASSSAGDIIKVNVVRGTHTDS